jgi:hypothetical protein
VPEWVIQVLFACGIGALAWFLRGLRTDVDEMKIDLAKNYVTHDQLKELKRDQRRTLNLLLNLQIQLARRFGFKPLEIDEDQDET